MKKKPAVRHRLSTVQRIFFSYVFICLVPVVILAGVLAVSTFRAQQREDAARQAHTAELAARTLDAEFKRVQGLGQQLSETQWVKRRDAAAGLYDEEFGLREKLAICGDLRGYTAASGVIRQLSVVFPEKEEVYSSVGFYDTADFFRTFSLEKGQTPLESAVVYERLSLPENSGLVCGAQLGMTGGAASRLFFAEAMEYNRPMRSFLLVELDRSAIRNQIALLRTDDMLSLSIRSADRELAGISFTARAAEADYTYRSVCFPVDITSGFSAVPLVRTRSVWFIAVLVLISVLLTVNLAWLLTKLTYTPLKRLADSAAHRLPAPVHAGDEYAIIEESLCQLAAERENVLHMAERYRATARSNFLRRLLQGYFDAAEAAEKMREFDIGFSDSMSHLVLLVEEREGSHGVMPLEEALSSFDLLYEITELSRTRLAAIVAPGGPDEVCPQTLAQRVALSYQEHTETMPFIACGSLEEGVLGISKSYYAAAEQLSARLSDGACLTSPDRGIYYPVEWELQLINRAKAGQQAMAETILGEIRAENERRGVSQQNMRRLVLMLAQTYSRIIHEFDPQPARYAAEFDAVSSAQTDDGMWGALYRVNALFCAEKTASQQAGDTEQQVVEYVKEHLTDPDLSLKDLGDRFNLSVSAVSKLFKRVCGINFYDFLLSGRMELACEMLENKKITLAAAARAVGYENDYSFKRAFSRFYGVSVSEYLRRRRK